MDRDIYHIKVMLAEKKKKQQVVGRTAWLCTNNMDVCALLSILNKKITK